MKRTFTLLLAVGFLFAFAFGVQAEVTDPIGVVKLRPGEPIHIGYWFVISGPNTSLGTDTVRGMEIASDDFGGEIKGHPIKISGQDTGCGAEGGQAAATKLAADPSIVAAIGSNCSSAAQAGVPILWKAGIPSISPSNTAPPLTAPDRSPDFDGYRQVLLGRSDAMVDPGVQPYDVCAPAVLIREAGGTFTSLKGEDTIYGGGAIASNGLIHDELVAAL